MLAFLDPLPVARLWGVGKVGQRRLQRLGLKTIRDIRCYDRSLLENETRSTGATIFGNSPTGSIARSVVPDRSAKQISHERTFSDDQSDDDLMQAVVCFLCEQTAMRLRRSEKEDLHDHSQVPS